jgi:hypothetical protein
MTLMNLLQHLPTVKTESSTTGTMQDATTQFSIADQECQECVEL